MKFAASFFIILTWAFTTVMSIWYITTDADWGYERSPTTNICYEFRNYAGLLSWGGTMSPVDDKYCE